jgi:hypothetical protein
VFIYEWLVVGRRPMQRSRVLFTLVAVLAFGGLTPPDATARQGYLSFGIHGPYFGFGFGIGHRPHSYYRPYYYRPYSYRPYVRYYAPRPYYYRPYAYVGVYPAPAYVPYQGYSYGSGAIRTLVKPKEAQVYVDGYYAGIVDDFDGTFQKLYLRPGEHVIELRLEGHKTFQQRILVTPSHTQKIHHEMVPLAPGETEEALVESPKPQDYSVRATPSHEPRQAPPPPPSTAPAPEPRPSPSPRSTTLVRFGVLTLRVQPAVAEVRIDGELWGNLGGMEELSIHLPAGTHRIELRRDSRPVFSTEVDIRRGETTPLNVRLAP